MRQTSTASRASAVCDLTDSWEGMLTSIKIWNEPNNASHWDRDLDPAWDQFTELLSSGASAIREISDTPIVLGGLSPIDLRFLRILEDRDALRHVDVLAVHGFPLDWNLWPMEEWPARIAAVRDEFQRPVWVTETGVSSFVSEEKAAWGIRRMQELLRGERVFWYTLMDLRPDVEATTRHREAEGSGYFRHFHFGLLRHDGTPKKSVKAFDPSFGICQWFQFGDQESLERAVEWFHRLGVTEIRTGLSWAESHVPGGWKWFDTIMSALEPFDVCATLCFTPPSIGVREHHTSPPRDPADFAGFARQVVQRYASRPVPQVTG